MAINFGAGELGYVESTDPIFDNMQQGSLLLVAHPASLGVQRAMVSKGDNPTTTGWLFDNPADTDDFRFIWQRATTDAFARSDSALIVVNDWQLFGVSWDLRGVGSDDIKLWYGNYSDHITAAEVPTYKVGDPVIGSGALTDDSAKALRFANTDAASTTGAFAGKEALVYITETPLDEGDVRKWMWKPRILHDNVRTFAVLGYRDLSVQDLSGRGIAYTVNADTTTRHSRHTDVVGFHFGTAKRQLSRPVALGGGASSFLKILLQHA